MVWRRGCACGTFRRRHVPPWTPYRSLPKKVYSASAANPPAEDIAMLHRSCRLLGATLGLCALVGALGTPRAQALTFNFIHDPGINANALAGFTAAGAR